MGGKSTYIRSTGICTLLAHIGCFVPASFAEITLLDAILCRIGSSDSQSDGVSTFMSEMLEMSAIISSSSPNSLLLIDELGRGTSTHDGMALAWAIAHHIATEKQAFCLFSTHFHQVTALSSQVSCIHNLHVSFHIVSSSQESDPTSDHVTMLYKVRMGACERSFGVQLAASLKSFPSEVIETAKAKLVELEYGNQVELDVKEDANGKINAFLESVNAIAHNSDYEEKEALDLIEDLKKSLLQDKNPILQQILPLH